MPHVWVGKWVKGTQECNQDGRKRGKRGVTLLSVPFTLTFIITVMFHVSK